MYSYTHLICIQLLQILCFTHKSFENNCTCYRLGTRLLDIITTYTERIVFVLCKLEKWAKVFLRIHTRVYYGFYCDLESNMSSTRQAPVTLLISWVCKTRQQG